MIDSASAAFFGEECMNKCLESLRLQAVIYLIVSLCLILTACLPQDQESNVYEKSYKIVTKRIGHNTYFVPEPYLALSGTVISEESLYVVAMYPEFAPPLEQPKDLSKKGEWYKNISILLEKRKSNKPFSAIASGMINHHKAYEVVGEEYGLIHQKQPEGEIQDFKDLWLEKNVEGDFVSYIACSEKLSEASVPQCTQHLFNEDFRFKISFDKRFLQDWEIIKSDALTLIDSFKSEQTAKEFLNTLLELSAKGKG